MNIYKERIYPLLQSTGKPDSVLEDEIGLPRGTLYNWKKGRVQSYEKYSSKIAIYFHTSTDYILGNTNNPSPLGQKNSPPPGGDELDEVTRRLFQRIEEGTAEERKQILDYVDYILSKRNTHE